MNDERKLKNITALFGKLSLICAAIGLVLVLVLSFFAVKETGGMYRAFREADLADGFSGTLSYNDRLYAQLGYGAMIDRADADKEAQRTAFLENAMRGVDERICGAGLLYTMMVAVVFALFLTVRFGSRPKHHLLAIVLSAAGVYLLFLAAVAGMFAVFGVPFYLPAGFARLTLCTGLASIIGGCCALGLVLRRVRYKAIVAIVAVPLAAVLIVAGMLVEGGLFAVPTVDTFDYVYEIYPPEENEDMYYDDVQNVLVVGDEIFPPEPAPNPTRYTGVAAVGGAAFEALNPFGGNGLDMVRQIEDERIPAWVIPLYLLKALLWAVLLAALPVKEPKRREEDAPDA